MASLQGVSEHSPATLAPDTLRAWISQELADLDIQEQSISRKRAELKELLNSLLPIHKLPNELLVQIFSDFRNVCGGRRDTDIVSVGTRQRRLFPASWSSPLTLVCRRWRDVLISAPAFWREIDLGRRIEWTELCLSRSIPAAVEVSAHSHYGCRLNVLHPHVHRFQAFLFTVEKSADLRTALPPFFGSGMPLLEDLDFTAPRPSAAADCSDVDVHLTSEWFPCLRTLALSRTAIPRDIPLYARLRMLTLRGCYPKLSFDDFLDALAASVQLEELALFDTLVHLNPGREWMHGGRPIPRRPPILLPRLRDFLLQEPGVIHTSWFLAHLHLPPSAHLSIAANIEEPSPDTTISLSAMLPPDPSTTILSLAIAIHVTMVVTECCEVRYKHPNPAAIPAKSPRDYSTLTLDLDRDQWRPYMAQGLDDLVHFFAGSPLTFLMVWGDHTYGTAAAWGKVFRTFPLLEGLEIGGYNEVAVVFRGLHAASSRPHADSTVACQNLKNVVLRGMGEMETYDAMRECFRWRGDRGVVLKVIDLRYLRPQDASMSHVRRTLVEDSYGAVEHIR